MTSTVELARAITPSWGQQFVAAAFQGDPDAALSLMVANHDYARGKIVKYMWDAKVAPDAFREALKAALDQTNCFNDVIAEAGTADEFKRWCRYAQFKLPKRTRPMLKIYRGGNGVPEELVTGWFWSLHKRIAARFAWEGTRERHLIWAMVPRDQIIFYSNDREEHCVIPDRIWWWGRCERIPSYRCDPAKRLAKELSAINALGKTVAADLNEQGGNA